MQLATSTSARALFVAGFMALAPAAHAFDPSGNDIADALMANIEATGATVTAGSVTGGSDDVEISDLKAVRTKGNDTSTLTIRMVSLTDSALTDGKVSAGEMTLEGMKLQDDETTLTVDSLNATDISLPAAGDIEAKSPNLGSDVKYKVAEMNGILIEAKDEAQIPIESITVKTDDYVGDIPRAFSLDIANIGVKKAMLDAKGKAMFDQLGYDDMKVSVVVDGSWDDATGVGDIKTFKISAADVGTLSMMAKIGGLTPDVVAKMQALQDSDDPKKAMQLLQNLTIDGLSIRFDDDSVVERALDAQAKEMGTTRDALVEQLSGALPLMLSALQNPKFQKTVSDAAAEFLKERKTIVASANPSQPVPIAQIVGTAMVAPQTIPDVLSVNVTTNP